MLDIDQWESEAGAAESASLVAMETRARVPSYKWGIRKAIKSKIDDDKKK